MVDGTELADLKYLLANAVAYAVPDYVRHLASDVVNGNRANATFLGQALGNLVAGSSETHLNKLIDKWFRGADHPVTNYTYKSFAGSLFVNGPAYDDSDQGYLGDCYFIAAMDAIADSSPVSIQNMFVDNGDNTWTVRFYVSGVADYVSVDRFLPTNSSFAIYAGVGGTNTDSRNELWMALAEKAYTQWNETGNADRDGRNAYASIEGGWMQAVSQQVLGKAAQAYWSLNDSDKQHLVAAVNANKAVTYGSKSNPGNGMVGPHAYMVTSYDASTDKFQLYNPWGSSHPGPLTYAQLRTSGQCFVVADPAGSAAATSGVSGGLGSMNRPVACAVLPDSSSKAAGRASVRQQPVEQRAPVVNDRPWAGVTKSEGQSLLTGRITRVRTVAGCDPETADKLFAAPDCLSGLLEFSLRA